MRKSEPKGPYLEHLFNSLLKLYDKLKELGFTYYNGKVSVTDAEEVESHI